jgi:hypothetical protein
VAIGDQVYASNAGSASVSRLLAGPGGAITLLDTTSTDRGTVAGAVGGEGIVAL